MPRRARISAAGIPMHVIHRGNNRSFCFVSDEDRSFYLFHLGRMLPRFGCRLHAYCLMTNHVHLLLTPSREESCGLLMKNIAQLCSQYMNRLHRRTGTLWEGRFRSCLVQSELYVLSCYRYIESNPVRARMVGRPGEYEWSSYHANANGLPDPVVEPHAEYLNLGGTDDERRRAYRPLFGSDMDTTEVDSIRAATNGGYALGDEAFRRALAKRLHRRVEKGDPGRPKRRAAADDGQYCLLPSAKKNVVCP
jgi:putative transposase